MYLRAVEYVLPQRKVSHTEIAAWTGKDAEFIKNKVGVENRHFLSPGESTSGLASEACEKLFENHCELDRSSVDFLILVTQNNDYKLPHGSAILQGVLKLPEHCACFDLNLGCSGFVYALSVAKGFAIANGFQHGLIVTCDPYSKIMDKADGNTVSIFGDAAAATWVSSEGELEVGSFAFGTDGSKFESLIVKKGGSAGPIHALDEFNSPNRDDQDWRLEMESRAIFNFMIREIPRNIEAALIKNQLAREDIDVFLFHQASKFMLKTLIGILDVAEERVPISLAQTGNTVSSSIPLLLSDSIFHSDSKVPQNILLSGFGVGLSWATTVLKSRETR